jgi:hypothetical protein
LAAISSLISPSLNPTAWAVRIIYISVR